MTGSSPSPDEIDRRFAEIVNGWEEHETPRHDPEPFSFDTLFEVAVPDDDPYVPPPAEPVPVRTPMAAGFLLIGLAVVVAFARSAGVAVPDPVGWITGLGAVAGLILLLAQAWRRNPRRTS